METMVHDGDVVLATEGATELTRTDEIEDTATIFVSVIVFTEVGCMFTVDEG